MRLFLFLMLFPLIYIVHGKNNVKTLTESMGQEVIEIGAPIKELPMGLEEEPGADNDEDIPQKTSSHTIMPATKKDAKKPTAKDYNMSDNRKKMKDIEKIDGMSPDDEEARIEKELAEIYKDTADYKSESGEEPGQEVKESPKAEPVNDLPQSEDTSSEEVDKPIGRERTNFKFQPDSTDKAEIEKFRTSIDEISCNNRQKLSGTPTPRTPVTNKAFDSLHHGMTVVSMLICYIFMCT
ncbi:uncharacterized protein LOC113491635 [Trichoplusia ni]|uniref:Uncharacterized protein LOC113491635 n=1 Tax=Trichoplusia ni TaxID=7111 RepID=A0A7E5V898_TRINI|nr:uncharacterized protein LOC113491635 [Trichoplusia ni]